MRLFHLAIVLIAGWMLPGAHMLRAGEGLTEAERARLVKALAVIEARGTNIMPHSNLGVLLGDAAYKEREIGDGRRIPSTIPIYERVARTLTNAIGQGSGTNAGR
jgi:hypothetical protein